MATKQPTSQLLLMGDEHSGRDEMNLAGHPFALLQSPKRENETSIFYEWKRRIESGRIVTASWRVETPAAFGLPGPEEELLYLVLLQLTREAAEVSQAGEWPLQVKFSRGDVLRRLGWDSGARRYAALELAFNRLVAVTIGAKHAFFDARTRAPINAVSFHILNEFSLVDEPRGRRTQSALPLSHFEWNTTLHTSFLAGNVRSMALDFAISLDHPTSRRLFRLLEVLAQPRKNGFRPFSMGIWKLRDRLGMAPYRYPSKVAEKLTPAVAELISRQYLHDMTMEKDAAGAPMAVFRFQAPQTALVTVDAPKKPPQPAQNPQQDAMRALPDFGAIARGFDAPSPADYDEAAAKLDARFAALPSAEKEAIDARIKASMAPFLRDNPRSKGAQLELARGRRREMSAR